jgi:hypothetical protein
MVATKQEFSVGNYRDYGDESIAFYINLILNKHIMRELEGKITSHLYFTHSNKKNKSHIAASEPLLINSFEELVKKVAVLSFRNKDFLLFFRGQGRDHLNRNGNSSFYPSIYRTKDGENLSKEILEKKFNILDQACNLLITSFKKNKIKDSITELNRRKFIQWSILQHYEVCDTPLLDLTQSLRVACSFALKKSEHYGYIFVFGLPYITNRISINSEQDIVNIRLINICPPEAYRPYFQEGYLVGTADITTDYAERNELDFKRRLIAKFKIPNNKQFWGDQNSLEPYLMPMDDKIAIICNEIHENLKSENNIQVMFSGTWLNTYQFENNSFAESELFKIRNNNEYHSYGRHLFDIDSVFIDKSKGIIRFRKVGKGKDHRKLFNDLNIVNDNYYEGIETPGTKINYRKLD